MKKTSGHRVIVLLACLLLATGTGLLLNRASDIALRVARWRLVHRVKTGMSRQQVTADLGEPQRVAYTLAELQFEARVGGYQFRPRQLKKRYRIPSVRLEDVCICRQTGSRKQGDPCQDLISVENGGRSLIGYCGNAGMHKLTNRPLRGVAAVPGPRNTRGLTSATGSPAAFKRSFVRGLVRSSGEALRIQLTAGRQMEQRDAVCASTCNLMLQRHEAA